MIITHIKIIDRMGFISLVIILLGVIAGIHSKYIVQLLGIQIRFTIF